MNLNKFEYTQIIVTIGLTYRSYKQVAKLLVEAAHFCDLKYV